jgi:hypothetical protein
MRESLSLSVSRITLLALAVMFPAAAPAAVLMNELKVEDIQQVLELRNTGPGRVPLDLLGLQTSAGTLFPLAVGDTLEPGEHRVIQLPDAVPAGTGRVRRRGDVLELFDPALESVLDRMDFGDTGPAPADILAYVPSTIARVTSTPDPSGANSANGWTVDFVGTLGAANDAPAPALGGDVVINEIIPAVGNAVLIELHNRGIATVDLLGWSLTTAQCHVTLAGSLTPGGYRVFLVTPLIFDFNLAVYLLTPGAVRVDQMGLSDAPGDQTTYQQVLADGNSFQRFPDGNGPNNGYDLPSSGYPVSLQIGPPTPGGGNTGGGLGIGTSEAPGAALRLELGPNPVGAGGRLALALTGNAGGEANSSTRLILRVYDLQGRLVDRIAGPGLALDWSPARSLAPGVYFLRLERRDLAGALGSWQTKLTLAP